MRSLFDYTDYKDYVRRRIEDAGEAKGQWKRIAEALRIHPSFVSHVFRGSHDLSPDQACDLAQHLGLTAVETEYFVNLILLARSSSKALRSMLENKLGELRSRAFNPQPGKASKFGTKEQFVFYSNWQYSAVRLATAIPGLHDREVIAKHLGISPALVQSILEFLARTGLCVEKRGRYFIGSLDLDLGSQPELLARHHLNWRLRSLDRVSQKTEEEFFSTTPMAIRAEDIGKVRTVLLDAVKKVRGIIDESEPERLMCLNMDWIRL